MFEAVVGCSWKNEVGPPELLDVAQSLELRRVYDGHEKRVQLHMAVNWIIEHLTQDRKTAGHLNTKTNFIWKLHRVYSLTILDYRGQYRYDGCRMLLVFILLFNCLEHDMINNSIHLH